jgi:DNA-binding NtrC family response regulator
LFGHEKGAFTGAIARRVGKFEEANGGTLLLDEISEMDARLQAKLLRAIQEREIDRVGGGKPVKVDIRILATSNRDLTDAVKHGTFREGLALSLERREFAAAALRERPKDILALARHFGRKYAEANWRTVPSRWRRNGACAAQPCWRGNVRELENTIHRAVLLVARQRDRSRSDPASRRCKFRMTGCVRASDPVAIAPRQRRPRRAHWSAAPVSDVERELILDTLDHCLGNRTHAANILGISIRTLSNKLREYTQAGIRVAQPGEGRAA